MDKGCGATHTNAHSDGYARTFAAQPVGVDAIVVRIEADLSRGLHAFSLVGLPTKAVEEARDRISSAIRNTGFPSPKSSTRRIVLSLSPADLRKDGGQYDLGLAVSYLLANKACQGDCSQTLFCGELGLDGSVRTVRGVLGQLMAAARAGFRRAIIPRGNAAEASLATGIRIYAVGTLAEALRVLAGEQDASLLTPLDPKLLDAGFKRKHYAKDIGSVRGQETAKRALEIAAAGRHNLVLYGPPGTGKTLLARTLPGILPPLSTQEMLEATAIHSAAGFLPEGEVVAHPPWREPHHASSAAAIVGGSDLRPGEITLAHRGVLFLDEFAEFDARALESLREPLEEHFIRISRARGSLRLPADCMVVAAMNPANVLSADPAAAARHAARQARKLSRPIAERMDIWVEVGPVSKRDLERTDVGESSESVRARVVAARRLMHARWGSENARVGYAVLERESSLSSNARNTLTSAMQRLNLSPRAYHRTIRVARTIADLDGSAGVERSHMLEALGFRPRGLLGIH